MTPYLESSFFWKSQVGRNTILTPSHMFGSENQNFLYYHGVANNLGMTDLSCYWLDGEIRRIWNCINDVFWKMVQDGGPQNGGNCVLYMLYVLFYIFDILIYIFYMLFYIFYILFYIFYYTYIIYIIYIYIWVLI